MRFMVMVLPGDMKGYEAGKMPEPAMFEKMGKFNEELVRAGVMISAEGLHPSSEGARVSFVGGKATVSQGPFVDSMVGGFWIWKVTSKEEALGWAKRAPMEEDDTLEIRQVAEPEEFGPEIAAQENKLRETMARQAR
jgi:hypothetical protein